MRKTKKEELPTTKEQCFEVLDGMVSEADQKLIAKSEDAIDMHFGLGMWIRNNWIYGKDGKVTKLFSQDNEDESGYIIDVLPDMSSDMILDEYIEYLKEKFNK